MAEYINKGITALIFDFDGTLAEATLDFTYMNKEAFAAMAKHINLPSSVDGRLMEILEELEDRHGASTMRHVRKAALDAVRRVEVEAAAKSRLFSYVRPMLAACREQGLKTGIITRNCLEALLTVFPDIDVHFACIVTRDDVHRVKPDPGHLLKALEMLHVAPENTLMCGDHPMDIAVGKRAGSLTAGIATGETDFDTLLAEKPDYCVHSGMELMLSLGLLQHPEL